MRNFQCVAFIEIRYKGKFSNFHWCTFKYKRFKWNVSERRSTLSETNMLMTVLIPKI